MAFKTSDVGYVALPRTSPPLAEVTIPSLLKHSVVTENPARAASAALVTFVVPVMLSCGIGQALALQMHRTKMQPCPQTRDIRTDSQTGVYAIPAE